MHSATVLRRSRSIHRALPLAVAPAVAAALSLGAVPARAQEAAPVFGRTGQIVLPELVGVRTGVPHQFAAVSGGLVIGDAGWGGIVGYSKSANSWRSSLGDATASEVESVWVAPAADVFVGRGVSIGLSVGGLYMRQKVAVQGAVSSLPQEAYSVAVAPRVGYVVPLSRGVSLWPRVSGGFSYSESESGAPWLDWYSASRSRSLSGGVDVALVYQPTEHLLFKLAPQIAVGRTMSESIQGSAQGGGMQTAGESTWLRVGGEATAGLAF